MARVALCRNQNKNPYEGIERSKVLALDIAQHCGYHSMHGGGTWDFTKVPHKHHEHLSFRGKLIEYIKAHDIKLIAAEDLIMVHGRGINAVRKLGEYRGVLLEVCQEFNIKVEFVAPSSIKMMATNKGNAKKDEVMKGVREKWGIIPVDDNHADAAACFFFVINKYKIL